ncbi:MAG TPA: sigma-70 family RNA polymerase sigma factor [Bacteroidota bacterium]|jgi:RNA polymerase sigma-70 factor (ECF subfamily)|nr:sigma-70 family RNA polymerase sigma factor [Bacteroidota bacterium]
MYQEESKAQKYKLIIQPHLNAAYNLARWLMRNDRDAEDVVQEACLRAYKFLDGFRGGDGRVWLLAIVRNTGYTWLQQNRANELNTVSFDDELHSPELTPASPDVALQRQIDEQMLREALEELPTEFREVIVLRELEGFSYKEIADLANIPLGTVMSRIARARTRLQQYFITAARRGED